MSRRPAAVDVALQWAMARTSLNARTSAIYAGIWSLWLAWLAARDVHWYEASATHLAAFLSGAAPGQSRRRPPKLVGRMANLTSQRYWSVLEDIYLHAAHMGWIEENPASAVSAREKPRVEERSRVAEVLVPGVLKRLRDPEWLRDAIPPNKNGDWLAVRDRAIVALLAHCALTSGELIALIGTSVRQGARAAAPARQLQLPGGLSGRDPPVVVDVDPGKKKEKDKKGRAIEIPPAALEFVLAWLERRKELDGLVPEGPLFPSRERPGKDSPRQPLEPATLYYVVQRCVLQAAGKRPKQRGATSGSRTTTRPNAHGPGVVRNSVLQLWLTKLPADQVAERAGLQSAASLRVPRPKEMRQ
jgi:integrase